MENVLVKTGVQKSHALDYFHFLFHLGLNISSPLEIRCWNYCFQ